MNKKNLIINLLLMVIPLAGISLWFFGIEMGGSGGGIGGGSYNLAAMFYPVVMAIYLVIYAIIMFIRLIWLLCKEKNAAAEAGCLLAAVLLIIALVIYLVSRVS